jgi:hypothetical protein
MSIVNIADGTNILVSIYFNPLTVDDSNITEIIQDEIVNARSEWKVIPNNAVPQQFAEIITEINHNMTEHADEDNNLCEGRINITEAINETMPNSHVIITIHSTITRQIYGFAVINFKEDGNIIYLEILCSHKNVVKGGGYILIKTLEKIGDIIGCKAIQLHSVRSAVQTYENYGFIQDASCRAKTFKDFCFMVKYLRKPRTDEERMAETDRLLEHGGRKLQTKQKLKSKSNYKIKRYKTKRRKTKRKTKRSK